MIVCDERLLTILINLVLNTTCSFSLYDLHFACVVLDVEECDVAIVIAVDLIQTSKQHIDIMKVDVLFETDICHTFDEFVDNYDRADDVDVLYLKKLFKIIVDENSIRSIIRKIAINKYVVAILIFFEETSFIKLLAMIVFKISRFSTVTIKRRSFEKFTKKSN